MSKLIFGLNKGPVRFIVKSTGEDFRADSDKEELAVEYNRATQDVTARVIECIECIRKGNPSEAVRLSQLAPPLFKDIASLDIPKRKDWVRIAKSVGVQTPDLPLQLIDELQDALDNYTKIGEYTSYFRRLNLFGRSKESRVAILKKLIQQDPKNTIWAENLERLK